MMDSIMRVKFRSFVGINVFRWHRRYWAFRLNTLQKRIAPVWPGHLTNWMSSVAAWLHRTWLHAHVFSSFQQKTELTLLICSINFIVFGRNDWSISHAGWLADRLPHDEIIHFNFSHMYRSREATKQWGSNTTIGIYNEIEIIFRRVWAIASECGVVWCVPI